MNDPQSDSSSDSQESPYLGHGCHWRALGFDNESVFPANQEATQNGSLVGKVSPPWTDPHFAECADLRLHFERAVKGPVFLGHSCHFGLGLFVPGPE